MSGVLGSGLCFPVHERCGQTKASPAEGHEAGKGTDATDIQVQAERPVVVQPEREGLRGSDQWIREGEHWMLSTSTSARLLTLSPIISS